MEQMEVTQPLENGQTKVFANHHHNSASSTNDILLTNKAEVMNGMPQSNFRHPSTINTNHNHDIKMTSEKHISSSEHKINSQHSPDKHRSSGSSSEKHKSSSSDKHKSGSSSSDRHKSSSSSSDRHKSSSSSSDKHKSGSSSSDRHKSSSSSSDKHKSGSSSSDRHKSSSSSSDKHKSSSSSSDRHKSSSSSEKHKSSDKHSSSADKQYSLSGEKNDSSSHVRESSSSKHSSSTPKSSHDKHRSEKHKTSHSGSSGDKPRSDDHRKSSGSSDKHRSTGSHKSSSVKVKSESDAPNSSWDEHKSLVSEQHTIAGISVKQEPSDDETLYERSRRISGEESDNKLTMHATVTLKRESDQRVIHNSVSEASTVLKREQLTDEEDDEQDEEDKEAFKKAKKRKVKSEDDDDEDYENTVARKTKKTKTEKKAKKRKSDVGVYADQQESTDEEIEVPSQKKKKVKGSKKKVKKEPSSVTASTTAVSPQKGKKPKKEEEQLTDVWRWWEEEKTDDSIKWKFLEHKGPVFADVYVPLPNHVKFYYDGKPMKLAPETEEVMTFYGKMLDHDYTTKEAFNTNFLTDWRSVMTLEEKQVIRDLSKCNFSEINDHFKQRSEERKNRSKEEKQAEKAKNEAIQKEYGTAIIDGYRQKIGNFKIEPPSLFRGRGEHPKMGCLKKRIWPKDVIINCSKDSKVPVAPYGQQWKDVRHDNTVTWLASWTENVQGQNKYVMLNASSRLKGEKDWQKYETARKLHKCVDVIRASYREDMQSKEMRIRQRAVAMYFIDKLALRAGNEKEEDTADTVGCCTLRVEHIRLHDELGGKQYVIEFDFLGKDSMRYQNQVAVDKRAFKNIKLFMQNKQPGDDLFDRLNTTLLNKHLMDLMEGLTAKVFRTFNASKTLQDQLELLTKDDEPLPTKLLAYNRANRAVAVLCNHQRSVSKNFGQQMENLQTKINAKKLAVKDAKKQVKAAKADVSRDPKMRVVLDKKSKMLARLKDQLTKLEVAATDKDENKDIALGTSKLNYLDPRISVAWCKKFDVPVEKVYNKTQREKFQWAINMATSDFHF